MKDYENKSNLNQPGKTGTGKDDLDFNKKNRQDTDKEGFGFDKRKTQDEKNAPNREDKR